jgi:hypothetical protein
MTVSRRKFCPILLGVLPFASARAAAQFPRIRHYRVDAVVSMLGVPLLTCSGVGSAFLAIREEHNVVSLHFAGGSDPEHAHGIVYAGSMEETVTEQDSSVIEASYFGFITASKDDSVEQARHVMAAAPGASRFAAVEAVHRPGRVCFKRALVVSGEGWKNWAQLIRQVRAWFVNAQPAAKEISTAGGEASNTFLYAVLRAARSAGNRWEGAYVHSGRQYRLECEKSRGPIRDGVCAERLTGKIRETGVDRMTTFRCWMEEGNDLPVRIDFQPRPYLRLSLEKEEA